MLSTIRRRALIRLAFVVSILPLVFLPTTALAADGVPGPGDPVVMPDGPVAGGIFPLYLMGLSALVPIVGYALNHYAPWASEPVKGLVQGVLAAGVAVLYQVSTLAGNFNFLSDETLYAVLTAMATALFAHFGWKAARVNIAAGGGTNKAGGVSDPHVLPTNPPGAPDVAD